MDRQVTCFKHGNLNEIYCKSCRTYMCSECIEEHKCPDGHKPSFAHVFSHSQQGVLPLFDEMIKAVPTQEEFMKSGAGGFIEQMGKIIEPIKSKVRELSEYTQTLNAMVNKLDKGLIPTKTKTPDVKVMKESLERDKKVSAIVDSVVSYEFTKKPLIEIGSDAKREEQQRSH